MGFSQGLTSRCCRKRRRTGHSAGPPWVSPGKDFGALGGCVLPQHHGHTGGGILDVSTGLLPPSKLRPQRKLPNNRSQVPTKVSSQPTSPHWGGEEDGRRWGAAGWFPFSTESGNKGLQRTTWRTSPAFPGLSGAHRSTLDSTLELPDGWRWGLGRCPEEVVSRACFPGGKAPGVSHGCLFPLLQVCTAQKGAQLGPPGKGPVGGAPRECGMLDTTQEGATRPPEAALPGIREQIIAGE